MLDELQGKHGLLIHHWDTDGICSAVLLMQRLGTSVENRTPLLGNYYLTEDELNSYSGGYDYIIVADMALPEENIRRLASSSQVLIFDHHLQPLISGVLHENPISKGESPERFPSASWIVNSFLGNQVNLYAILGMVGDHEERLETYIHFTKILYDFCLQHHMTFKELLAMVYLIDSNYKIGDRKAVMEAPRFLLGVRDPQEILRQQAWKKNLVTLDAEVARWVKAPGEEVKGVCVKRISTKCNIISTVTRKVFWESKKDTVLVNTGFFKNEDQVYVRSAKNLEVLIRQGKEWGCKCGGKAEVLGAIVPKGMTETFVDRVISFLSASE